MLSTSFSRTRREGAGRPWPASLVGSGRKAQRPIDHGELPDHHDCARAQHQASRIRRRLRDVQTMEIELGERPTAYLAYAVLRRGWNQ